MCTFNKQIDGKTLRCPYSTLVPSGVTLPVDSKGLCIFHSIDSSWKTENKFSIYLQKTIDYQFNNNNLSSIYLETIVFPDDCAPLFYGKTLTKPISFNYSIFSSEVTFENITFKRDLSFIKALFEQNVYFRQISGHKVEFQDASFNRNLFFSNNQWNSNFFMTGSQINEGIKVEHTTFHGYTFFDKMEIGLDRKKAYMGCSFKTVSFEDFSSFDKTTIFCITFFENVKIEDVCSFHETIFYYNDPIPIHASVNFLNIKVGKQGKLEFWGTPKV